MPAREVCVMERMVMIMVGAPTTTNNNNNNSNNNSTVTTIITVRVAVIRAARAHQGQPLSSPSRWAGHPHPVVECRTTQGSFAVEIRPDWAPRGAERYLQLVESGFFTNNLFYRVPERSHPIAQVTNCPVSDSQCMTVILLRAYQLTRHSFTHSHTRLLTCSHVSTLCNLVLVSV